MSSLVGDAPPAGADAPTGGLAVAYRRFVRWRGLLLLAFAALLAASMLLNVALGPAGLPLARIVSGLLDPDILTTAERLILFEVRLPYAVLAVLVGACLGLAGAEMQTVLNNPLASPSTLGVMYAATLGASVAILVGPEQAIGVPALLTVPAAAFVGALLATLLIVALSRWYGATVENVVLFGIALVFALDALISLVQFVADSDSLQQIVFWTMGSLARARWDKVAVLGVTLAICLPLSLRHVWQLTALRGGEQYARSFGIAVERLRLVVLIRACVLTAVAVAFTGVIGFVGLVGPHIARLALGEDHRFFLPGSALAGALILSGASIASKSIIPGILIPDGIVTALIGVPLLIGLLLSRRRPR